MAVTDTVDLEKDRELYLTDLTGTTVDYTGIVLPIFATADGLVFLTVFPGKQLCIVHSVRRFNCGLVRPIADHNCIFGILGEKLGGSLPPIYMVPVTGLVPCI